MSKVRDTVLFLGNLHSSIHKEDIENILSEFGHIENIIMNTNQTTGEFSGSCYAKMSNYEECNEAIKRCCGRYIYGKKIICAYADISESSPYGNSSGRLQGVTVGRDCRGNMLKGKKVKASPWTEEFVKSITVVAPIEILIGTLVDLKQEKQIIRKEVAKRMLKKDWDDIEPLLNVLISRVEKRRNPNLQNDGN